MARVAVLGSLNVDVVTLVERHPRPGETVLGRSGGRFAGGKGGNQAAAAARSGAQVQMLGRVGAVLLAATSEPSMPSAAIRER